MTPAHDARPVSLGEPGRVFLDEALETARVAFNSPLAKRIAELQRGEPFALMRAVGSLPQPAVALPPSLRGRLDRVFDEVVGAWIDAAVDGARRLLVLEEILGREGDPYLEGSNASYLEHRPYFVAMTGGEVSATRARQYGHPGIGVLAELRAPSPSTGHLTERELNDIAAFAVAIIVRGWDDQGYLVSCVGGPRLSRAVDA